ncbi:unnamed protein product, partial [Sphacelaria rigidula]
QVIRKGATVDLILDVFWMAMQGSRHEIGFPETVQWDGKPAFYGPDLKRDINKVRDVLNSFPAVSDMQACIERKDDESNFSFADKLLAKNLVEQASRNHALALAAGAPADTVLSLPYRAMGKESAEEMGNGEDLAMDSGPARTLREGLEWRNKLAYPLLRWLLSANRAHLRPLNPDELITEIPCERQFVLVTGEKQSTF